MQKFRDILRNIKDDYDAKSARKSGLACKVGSYGGCAVLKLQKPSWTNDDMQRVPNESGIFFSVWLDERDVKKGRAYYNIHALKLRELKGYRMTSRDFAEAFREAFNEHRGSWLNVSDDFGPQTLMQGWFILDTKSFERDVRMLMHCFEEISPIIDDLLGRRIAPEKK